LLDIIDEIRKEEGNNLEENKIIMNIDEKELA
jgi:hypothetical protein